MRLKELKEAHPEAEVELWAEDEARLGLKPVTRRVWAPVGRRPVARFKRGYEWTYLYGFVRPHTGEVYWLILPTVSGVEVFSLALCEFAKEVEVGENKRVLLVVDKVGWHTGGGVEVPEGMHLEFLPSGSPELQPAKRLWPLTNEAVVNRLFEEIGEIEESLVERCVQLLEQPEAIRDRTNYRWWPQAGGPRQQNVPRTCSKNSLAGFGITQEVLVLVFVANDEASRDLKPEEEPLKGAGCRI